MSHNLLEIAPGEYAAGFARVPAWHRLGQVMPDLMTATEALDAAHLSGWNIRKVPLTATEITDDGVTSIPVPDKFATVWTNPVTGEVKSLGVVGSQYTIVQHEESVGLLDAITDESGAHVDTIGALDGGRRMFAAMKVPTTMKINGQDPHDLYLVVIDSHDGTSGLRFIVSPTRVVCQNTLNAAIGRARASFSLRHTTSINGRVQQAREALGLTFEYMDALQEELEALTVKDMDDDRFKSLMVPLLHEPGETDKARERAEEHIANMQNLFRSSPTINGQIEGTADWTDTAYGAYQAVTEYVDHFMPVQNSKRFESKDQNRAFRAVLNSKATDLKSDAFQALVAA